MKRLLPVLLLSAGLIGGAWMARAEEPVKTEPTKTEPAKPEPVKADPAKDIEKSLEQKVTFEFEETPLSDVLAFFQQISKVNFVADQTITNEQHNPSVNLKVADMSLKLALGWVCRLTECDWEVKDGAVHVFVPKTVLQDRAVREKEERARQERLETIASTAPAAKLHVRFSDGTEVTAEGSIFYEQSELAKKLLDRALDPGREGILAYKIGDADEANSLLARLVMLVPKAKGEYVEDDGLLFLTSDEQPAIRKAAAFMRKLGHYDVEVAGEPRNDDADDDGDDIEVEEVEAEEDAQPMAPPAEDPKAVNF